MGGRRTTSGIGVLAVALVAAASAVVVAAPRAGACSRAAMDVDFDGTVRAIDGGGVTYRVDEVREAGRAEPGGAPLVPAAGRSVTVTYEEPPDELQVGEAYRVVGWSPLDGPHSQIAYDFDGDCGTGAGTTRLDGSLLGDDGRGWVVPAVVVAVALGALAVVAFASDRRWHRRQAAVRAS